MLLASCGVKHKKAGDVSSAFAAPASDIKEKVFDLCSQLNLNDNSTFDISSLPFKGSMCTEAGDIAANLGSGNFKFTNVSIDEKVASSGVQEYSEFSVKLQAQLWLNKNISELFSTILNAIKKSDDQPDSFGIVSTEDQIQNIGGKADIKIHSGFKKLEGDTLAEGKISLKSTAIQNHD